MLYNAMHRPGMEKQGSSEDEVKQLQETNCQDSGAKLGRKLIDV